MANAEHVEVVRKGAEAIAEWRRLNPGEILDLSDARLWQTDLTGANLSAADLSRCDLFDARLSGANLSMAMLRWANLAGCELTLADLSEANLVAANLTLARLTGAMLIRAKLTYATLSAAYLVGTNFSEARLGLTSLSALDLSRAVGLATVRHEFPSSVGVETLGASIHAAGNMLSPELETFFRAAGVPQVLLSELPRLVAEVKYHTCFISYGHPDLTFAETLCQDLEVSGVSCWLYDLDKTVGKPTWGEIERKLDQNDKMVVVCSIDALMRDGVKKEIDKQIDKNADKLMPVSLDDRWTHPGFTATWGARDLKPWLMEPNYADFAGWESDPERYQKAFEDLLRGLRREGA